VTLLQDGWLSLGFDPTFRQEVLKFFFARIMHELFEDPFKVGEGIEAMTTHLLDEGVDDSAAPASAFVADEHPVLHSEFGRANRSFGVVVIELDLAVHKAGFKVLPLVDGIVQRFAQGAFGQDSSCVFEMLDEFLEMIVNPSRSRKQGWDT
jgi:hypothetical protein